MEDQPHATALTKNEIIRSGLKQGWLAPGVEDSGKPQGWWLPRGSVLFRLNHPEPSQSPLVSRVFRYSPNPSRRCSHSIRRALNYCSACLSARGSMAQVRAAEKIWRGTDGSNPSPSSAESATNLVAAGGGARGWDPEFEPLCSSGESTPLFLAEGTVCPSTRPARASD